MFTYPVWLNLFVVVVGFFSSFFFLFSWNQLEVLLGAWQMVTNLLALKTLISPLALPGTWQAVSTCSHSSCLIQLTEVFRSSHSGMGVGWEWNLVWVPDLPPSAPARSSQAVGPTQCGHCLDWLLATGKDPPTSQKYKVLSASEM